MARLGPLPDAPNTLKCRYIYSYNGRAAYNVFHVAFTGSPPSGTDMSTLAGNLQTNWVNNIKPLVNANVTLTATEVADMSSRTGLIVQNVTSAVGTVPGTQACPNNVALCVSLNVAYRFRGGHARIYLPGMITANITGGTNWSGTYVTSVGAAIVAWRTAINSMTTAGNSYTLVMTSYYTHDADHKPIYRPVPVNYPVTGVFVHSRVDSQRRRLGKETT